MSSVDESITHCLEEIESNFVKAIDIVASIKRSIRVISTNMRELDAHSQVWFSLFDICGRPTPTSDTNRESIGTLVLTEDDNLTGLTHRTEIDDPPSFLQEYSESFLEGMSPPRTTKVYKPLNTPGGEKDTSAMDTSSSSLFGYSPPQTPLLKRRKPEEIARASMELADGDCCVC